jgi:site-specific DNA recombinase
MDLAIIAGRVSTKDQADHGYSLPEQVAAGLAYAQEKGYQLADVPGFSNADTMPAQPGVFIEDFTGMSMDRPALDAMRDIVKQRGIKVIIYTETDRLARKRIYGDLLEIEFEELGARVEYAIERFDDSDEGRLFKDVKKALAEYERVKILRRMRVGKAGRVKSGKVLIGNRAPYGYRRSDDHEALVIDEAEAEIVRCIFRWYIEGLSNYAIAARLNEQQVPTYAGPLSFERRRGWRDTHIITILACETYTGTWHFNKHRIERKPGQPSTKELRPRAEWIAVSVPPIIDNETFAQARARAEYNRTNAKRNRKRLYLFAGMLKCEACGWSFTGSTLRDSPARYCCRAKTERDQRGNRLCTMPYYSERDLDDAIWPWLFEIVNEPREALRLMREAGKKLAKSTERIMDRVERIGNQMDDLRLRIANLDEDIELEHDAERRAEYRLKRADRLKRLHDLEIEQIKLLAEYKPNPWTEQGLMRFGDLCREYIQPASAGDPQARRKLYELVQLKARLEVKDGQKLAHVSCIIGEQTFTVGSIVNVAKSGCRACSSHRSRPSRESRRSGRFGSSRRSSHRRR